MKILGYLKKTIIDNSMLCLSSLFLSYTLFLFAPIILYLSNLDEFWFNLYHITGMAIAVATICFLIMMLIGLTIKRFVGDKVFFIYETMIFAVGICVYIHSNFLNLKIGDFNGAQVNWEQYKATMIKNLVIWVVIIIVCFLVRILKIDYIKRYLKFIPLFLTMLEVIALISVISTSVLNGKTIWSKAIKVYSDSDICELGDNDNILVFVLDMFDATSLRQIIDKEPGIVNELQGFRIYDNYTGLYEYTNLSMNNIINNKSYIDSLINSGYDISIYTDIVQAIQPDLMNNLQNYTEKSMYFRNNRTKLSLIYKMVACQYMPDIIKPYVWLYGDEFSKACVSNDGFNYYITDNGNFRDIITERDFAVSKGTKNFKIIHTDGGHDPFYIDADGNDVDPYFDDYYSACRGSLRIVQKYLNKMKENGTYDSSSIIITADHGWRSDHYGLLTAPMMMIKEKGASGMATISKAPVSQDDLPATILKLAMIDNFPEYGVAIMDVPEDSKRERVTYNHSIAEIDNSLSLFGTMKYLVKPGSNDWDSFILTDEEISPSGKLISHSKNCKTCIEGREPVDDYGWKSLIHYATDDYIRSEK